MFLLHKRMFTFQSFFYVPLWLKWSQQSVMKDCLHSTRCTILKGAKKVENTWYKAQCSLPVLGTHSHRQHLVSTFILRPNSHVNILSGLRYCVLELKM